VVVFAFDAAGFLAAGLSLVVLARLVRVRLGFSSLTGLLSSAAFFVAAGLAFARVVFGLAAALVLSVAFGFAAALAGVFAREARAVFGFAVSLLDD